MANAKEQAAQGDFDRSLRNAYLALGGYTLGIPSIAVKATLDRGRWAE